MPQRKRLFLVPPTFKDLKGSDASDPQLAAFLQPKLQAATADVSLWALAWTVAMDDDGKILVDCEHSIYATEIDDEVRANVHERMRRVNEVIGRIVV